MPRIAILLGLLAGCTEDLTGVEPLPAGNGYRDWVHHPDNPFTREIGGHPPGERYVYYEDLGLVEPVLNDEPALEGAVVVKEVYDEDRELLYLAVMRRLLDHPDANHDDGWVYSISRDNGKTEQLGTTCEGCHVDPLSLHSLWTPPPPP